MNKGLEAFGIVKNETRPPKPTNTYIRAGKFSDPFHKKGRVIKRGDK